MTTATTEKKTIDERIHAIMVDVKGVEKSAFNKHGNYSYAGHEAVTAALRGAYVKHGVNRKASVEQFSRTTDGTLQLYVRVTWTCCDWPESFDSVMVLGEAPTTTSNGKATGQQAGVAFSYAVKLAEQKRFSLTGDATPDPEEGDVTNEAVSEILARYEAASTPEHLAELRKEVLDRWKELSSGKQALMDARDAATKRITGK